MMKCKTCPLWIRFGHFSIIWHPHVRLMHQPPCDHYVTCQAWQETLLQEIRCCYVWWKDYFCDRHPQYIVYSDMRVKLLLLHVKRSQWRKFGHVIRMHVIKMHPGPLPGFSWHDQMWGHPSADPKHTGGITYSILSGLGTSWNPLRGAQRQEQ